MARDLRGRVELTWTNKHQRLITLDEPPDSERYLYQWVGPADHRAAEIRLLRPISGVGAESENLIIRGDALHALSALGTPGAAPINLTGEVRLAYLDPPFNTGKTFVAYEDNLEQSIWLTLMRDRLRQVQKLLRPDGSVWVHCDDSMMAPLRLVLDEVFGRHCHVGTIVWRSSDNSNNDAKQFSTDHNYIVVYSATEGWRSRRLAPLPQQVRHFANPDNDPRGRWFDGNPVNSPNPRDNLRYVLESPTGVQIQPPPNGWRWSRETLNAKIDSGEIRFTEDGRSIRRRTYLADHGGLPASSLWVDLDETGHNRQAKAELKRLFPGVATSDLFDTPKPEALMRKIIEVSTQKGDWVIDPFAGSGTTAAVAQKMGRRWVTAEMSQQNVEQYCVPRLTKVVEGADPGGITEAMSWRGGGGFALYDTAPSMFAEAAGIVALADWAVGGALGEATAIQLGFTPQRVGPFCGYKGRTRLAVVDGLLNTAAADLVLAELGLDEIVLILGTALEPDVAGHVAAVRPGSSAQVIPPVLLNAYARPRRWSPAVGRRTVAGDARSAGAEPSAPAEHNAEALQERTAETVARVESMS